MDAFGKIVSSVSQAFDFNQATLSGCVDIVVVQQLDGSLKSTPFHLRLGKLKVLKSKGREVKIHVNGFETELKMKLGEAGEGIFEQETNVRLRDYNEELGNRVRPNMSRFESQAEISEIRSQQNRNLANLLSMKNTPSNSRTSAVSQFGYGKPVEEKNQVEIDIEAPFDQEVSFERPRSKQVIIKTLRPTSDQLKSLNLRHGMNTISYTVHSNLQGFQRMSGHIYYWPSDANIIVSDIDGTITKTDFLGHFLPMVGKDWSQPGITPLIYKY